MSGVASSDHRPDKAIPGQRWPVSELSNLDLGWSGVGCQYDPNRRRWQTSAPILPEDSVLPAGDTSGTIVVLTDYVVYRRPTVHLSVS